MTLKSKIGVSRKAKSTTNPLDTLIREHVVPVMKAAGFAKKGRIVRRAAPNGDHAFLHLDADPVDPAKTVFEVSFWMVPLPSWEFAYRDHPKAFAPNASGALATCKVIPPVAVAHQSDGEGHFRSRCAFVEPDTRDLCGRELARVLADESVPWMVRLLDRRALLRETRINPNGDLVRLSDALTSEIMLRIDDDPVAEVTVLVDRAEEDGLFPSECSPSFGGLRRGAGQAMTIARRSCPPAHLPGVWPVASAA